jgi:hypothetical protein
MKKVIRLTESDLMRIVKRVIRENAEGPKNVPAMCDQSTVKSVSEAEAKSKKGQPGYHAWRDIEGQTPQYFLCRTKSGGEMEEGWLGDKLKGLKRFSKGYGDEGELESKRDEFMSKLEEFDMEVMENPDEYVKGDRWEEYRESLIDKAEENNFLGSLRKRTSPNSDKYFIVYFPGTTGLQNMASGAAGSVRSGMSNTNIAESRRRYSRRYLNENTKTYLIDGQAWTWVGTDTQSYQGKKASIEMKHVPRQGEKALPNKTWVVGCDTSINPKPTTGKDSLYTIAKQSLSC